MTEKDSRQDYGRLGAHVAGQGAYVVPGLDGFLSRRWNAGNRTEGGPHPGGHSLAEEQDKTEAATDRITQDIVSQLLVTSYPVPVGNGLGQRLIHCGFF